jgi:sporulation protein YlmC with PRC-barrel domain
MDTLRRLSILAALGLASSAFAQVQSPQPDQQPGTQAPPATESAPPAATPDATTPASPDPSAASSPHQREATHQDTTEAAPSSSPDPAAASSPHQQEATGSRVATAGSPKIMGLKVSTPTGESLGAVVDIVTDPSTGTPGYVAIAPVADSGGESTVVPFDTALGMVKDNQVVIDRQQLEAAPKVSKNKLQDKSNTSWKGDVDRYWSQAGAMRAVSPGGDSSQPRG